MADLREEDGKSGHMFLRSTLVTLHLVAKWSKRDLTRRDIETNLKVHLNTTNQNENELNARHSLLSFLFDTHVYSVEPSLRCHPRDNEICFLDVSLK